ncbi:MAG: YfhO family protein [Bacteroidales bacterium]|nr:YfhO family protein [Bacteroidales bacterium]MCL2738130.1 YfhO family protein [Bacteroidales bacterium]
MKHLKTWIPYICAGLFFVVLAYGYAPDVLKGKIVNQSDIASWYGMAREIVSHNEAHPHEEPTLWTNSMFSGMPAFTISVIYKGDFTKWLYDLLFLGKRPPSYLLISMIGGFLLLLAFGVNPWLSIVGAIGITFCSYNFQIIQVGHNSKMVAIAFMPWVLAAVVYAYRRRALLGAGLFALALSFQIKPGHYQITYYLAMMVFCFVAAEFYTAIKEQRWRQFMLASCAVLVGGLLGMATNINHLWPMQEYLEYSMRGGSELSGDERNAGKKGLKLDYATQWSYSPGETFNLLIPNFKGGVSSGEAFGKDSETVRFLKSYGYPQAEAERMARGFPAYWGSQPFTAGPMYMGAVVVFLFVLGLFLTRGTLRWWIMGLGIITLLLSWGGHAMWFTRFFSEYIPFYNKWRTVSMILVVFQILLPLLGIVAVQQLLEGRFERKHTLKSLYWAGGITAGFCLLMALIPSLSGSFLTGGEWERLPAEMVEALRNDRGGLLRADAFRSFCFISLSFIALWLFISKRIKPVWVIACLGILVLADFWPMGKRYLNSKHFVNQRQFQQQFAKRPVDEMILLDPDLYYRTLDMSVITFNDSHTSYWHKTIGGYSAAKLQRYQDMIDRYIAPEMNLMGNRLSTCSTWEEVEAAISAFPVLNMLNTKYVITQPDGMPLINAAAFGNAWFCSNIVWVSSSDEEIAMIGEVDVSKTAVIHESFKGMLYGFDGFDGAVADAGASIQLTRYAPNALEFAYSSASPQLAVFSDIWYPKGWKAWIDDKPVEILRANYILRALPLPLGTHTIRFAFAPESYTKGAGYSRISSVLLLLLLAAGIFTAWRKP